MKKNIFGNFGGIGYYIREKYSETTSDSADSGDIQMQKEKKRIGFGGVGIGGHIFSIIGPGKSL